jgi:hypothetical protein
MARKRELKPYLDNYDWRQAFDHAGASPDDIAEVLSSDEGENDEADWLMIGKGIDGRYFVLEAGCDYSGWDCHARGEIHWHDDLRHLWKMVVTKEGRQRLSLFSSDLTLAVCAILEPEEIARMLSDGDRVRLLIEHDKIEHAGATTANDGGSRS